MKRKEGLYSVVKHPVTNQKSIGKLFRVFGVRPFGRLIKRSSTVEKKTEVATKEMPVLGSKVTTPPKKRRGRPPKVTVETTVVKKITSEPKKARVPLSPKEKFFRSILRKCKLETLPELNALTPKLEWEQMKISDIAVFIAPPRDELLASVAGGFTSLNRINLSAEVNLRQVRNVAVDILSAGRMYMPIIVAKIHEDGKPEVVECISGRHRLALLALAYGADAVIPVLVSRYGLCEALHATIGANKTRPTLTLEKAEYRVLEAVGGDANIDRDVMYAAVVTKKSNVAPYCAFSVLDKELHGTKLKFPVVKGMSSRKQGGGLTTAGNLSGFWRKAIAWTPEVNRKDFDGQLRDSVTFLNSLVEAMQEIDGFAPDQHLAAMPLVSIGTYYRTLEDGDGSSAIDVVTEIAETIVGMAQVGRQKSDETYTALVKAMKK